MNDYFDDIDIILHIIYTIAIAVVFSDLFIWRPF
jgi:hypothetical protein